MILEAIYITFCLLLAWINKRLISYDRPIKHGYNALAHIAFWVATWLITKSWFPLIVLPFIGRLFFDAALNVMRRLPLDYVARNPKSVVDKWEKSIFGNDGILPKVIYIIVITVINIIHG